MPSLVYTLECVGGDNEGNCTKEQPQSVKVICALQFKTDLVIICYNKALVLGEVIMAMQYKTRGMSSPQGKARVYFCCHPQDFEVYFDSVSDEILNIQNCAIWFDTSDVPLDEERRLDLEQMQLFVMPVTTKLLTNPNRALSDKFSFAIKNHIPVLPIMMEGGLEELFSKKCGDLQFLDKTAHDPTAISYEEKLKKYLSSVLIGDELAAKVRAAFDAYIFLSYRKKDRKYAQELMQLIHQNDFCRDVAIWYDEYLIPGENFNTAIEDMLQRSDLFALAVTPNLLENPNYVLTQEYPKAKTAQKPILPIEAAPTDAEVLEQTYPGIPSCVHKEDKQGLSAALLASLRHIALRENNSDPQHKFFIGLAYLNGIDVEVDHTRARALITEAAEAGLPEAVKKLVEMYRAGIGVGRDYHEAIRWQKRLVDLRRTDYGREKDEESGHILAYELRNYGNFETEVGDISTAKVAYQQMLEVSMEMADSYKTVRVQRGLSVSYNSLGNIYRAESNLTKAKEYYQKCLDLRRQLAEKTDTVKARWELSASYNNLGNICKAESNLTQAKAYYRKSLELFRQLVEETERVEARRNLSISYNNLGNICAIEDNPIQAKEYYQKGLELLRQLAEETDTVEVRRDLSTSYNNLGIIYLTEGNLTQAREYYQRGLELRRQLAEETGTIEAYDDLAVSYYCISSVSDESETRDILIQAYKIWSMLCQKCPEVPIFQQRLNIVKELLDS